MQPVQLGSRGKQPPQLQAVTRPFLCQSPWRCSICQTCTGLRSTELPKARAAQPASPASLLIRDLLCYLTHNHAEVYSERSVVMLKIKLGNTTTHANTYQANRVASFSPNVPQSCTRLFCGSASTPRITLSVASGNQLPASHLDG